MSRHRLYYIDPHYVREKLRAARNSAEQIHDKQKELVEQLELIDRKRLYVRLGFNSLRGFCQHGLKFNRRQSQSLETAVREFRIAANFGEQR